MNGYGSSRPVVCPMACSSRLAGLDGRPGARRAPPSTEGTPATWSGLVGGKGVDDSVTERHAILLTLTAPSFGPVHSAGHGGLCHPGSRSIRCTHDRRLACSDHHDDRDAVVGAPLCADCYDFEAAVLQNACTPELWRRTTIYVLRHLAGTLGWTQRETKERVRLSYCRVAEFQRRGVVHLHAVIRADGVDGTPPVLTAEDLARAAWSAARAVAVVHPLGAARWGSQADVQVLDRTAGPRAQQVAGYVAKYPPRAPTAAAPSTPASAGRRTWPAVRSRRTCAGWPRRPGRSVATQRSSRTGCVATPTAWGTAAISCPSPTTIPPASPPSRRLGSPGGKRGGGAVMELTQPTVLSSVVCEPSASAGPTRARLAGRTSSSTSDSRSGGSATKSGTAGRSRIWSNGERGEAAMKRRQFGSVRKLPSGRWQASYWDVGRRHVAEVTLLTKADANAYLAAMETQIRRGGWIDPWGGHVGFAEWTEEWKSTIVDLRPSTKARDVGYIERYVLPRFGTLELGEIDHVMVRAWVAELSASGLAPSTTTKAAQLLSKIMRAAVQAGYLPKSPCDGVRLPRIERVEMRFLEPSEVMALADAMDPRYRAAVLLAAYGGLRAGELFGLRAKRVDPLRRTVTIAETVVDVGGHPYFGPPKTRAGRRTVPLPRVAAVPLAEPPAHLRPPARRPRVHRTGGRPGTAQRVAAALLGPGRARRRSGTPAAARPAAHRGGAVGGCGCESEGGGGTGRAHVSELHARPLRAPVAGVRATPQRRPRRVGGGRAGNG